jgi:SAM-dependent methyltransferase
MSLHSLNREDGAVTPRDPHQFVNELPDDAVQRLVDRLESRGKDPVFTRPLNNYLRALDLSKGARTLEVGSGTGVVTRALAGLPGYAGPIVGVDHSPVFVDFATRKAESLAFGDRVSYCVGDAHALGFESRSFDVVIAHTVLSHVTDPVTVLGEMRRVLSPGGVIVIFDGDYGSLTYASDDLALGRSMDEALAVTTFNSPLLMRSLPRLLGETGLELSYTVPETVAEIGNGSYFRSFAETYAPMVSASGAMSRHQVERWLGMQREALSNSTFFASCNYYSAFARAA